jgi:Skp family chaperone for outer membrane proteins
MSLIEGTGPRRVSRLVAALVLSGGMVAGTGVAATAAAVAPGQSGGVVVTDGDHCDQYKKLADYHYAKAKEYREKAQEYYEKAKKAEEKGDHEKAKYYRAKAKEYEKQAREHEKEAKEYEKKYEKCQKP